MLIKTGDTVVVIAGKNKYTVDKKGNKTQTTGKVIKALPKTNQVIVEGVNIVKKHVKPNQAQQSGSIIEVEAPISVSNVMLLDPKVNKPCRVSIKINEKGEKIRVSKKSGYEFK
ncbi:MAG: 50S ribosomal protein L24 [Anaeroplasmataceae bacterium]